ADQRGVTVGAQCDGPTKMILAGARIARDDLGLLCPDRSTTSENVGSAGATVVLRGGANQRGVAIAAQCNDTPSLIRRQVRGHEFGLQKTDRRRGGRCRY